MSIRRRNPFTPTFGHLPFTFAGRDDLIDDVIEGLANQPGDPNRATIFIGPRGSGKTVLLTTIAEEASQMGWVAAEAVCHEGLLNDLMYSLRSNAGHLLEPHSLSSITSIQIGPVGISREVLREDIPWRFRFQQVVEDLNAQDVGVLFIVDEVDPSCKELIEFIAFFQFFVTEDRDVAMLLGGLPSKVSDLLIDEHVSFVRRAFQRHLTSIPDADIRDAAQTTIEENGKRIDDDVLDRFVEAVKGFPYAMQLIGYHAWRYAGQNELITLANVEKSIVRCAQEMEYTIVKPTLRECSPREFEYLKMMAQDEGPASTSEIARRLGISMTNAANVRRRLIDRGIIKGQKMGYVVFDMPIIEDYLRSHPNAWY